MGPGFSPLDEALGLGGTRYSPRVLGWAVRLGAELPFARAAFWLEELTGVALSAATIRRQTEAVGATAVARVEAEVARLEREAPAPPARPERLVLGADGAMVPLVGGGWSEVKLLSVGVPSGGAGGGSPASAEAPAEARTTAVSYFARLADAATFGRLALVEVQQRGVEGAGAVAAVQDGAAWLQGFVDLHRPDAVRVLDWPHAVDHLRQLIETLFAADPPRCQRLLERLRRGLWETGPDRLLRVLAGWARAAPGRRLRPDQPTVATQVAYFQERRAQLAYPVFRAAGWPVGSGATESGHKQVMQARMKRAGMRWAEAHVNPLLALRLLDCNARWEAEGPRLLRAHRQLRQQARHARQQARRAARVVLALPAPPPPAPPAPPASPASPAAPSSRAVASAPTPPAPARHPWRRYGVPLSAKK